MDKAAVLAYCRVRDKQGSWVGCEVCFTIVYDVMIVCTSIYQQGLASDSRLGVRSHGGRADLVAERAQEAPIVRRMFSSSPRDPRYHMLSHISQKFKQDLKPSLREPRAALFLNRFTRTLTIMYATSGLQDVIGIPAEAMCGRSFYYCIAENCLTDAVKCLETAKGNDSIAYLRFWFRDPRIDDQQPPPDADSDDEMTGTEYSTLASEDGGVQLRSEGTSPDRGNSNVAHSTSSMEIDNGLAEPNSRTSSGDSTRGADTHEAIFGNARAAEESTSSLELSPTATSRTPPNLPLVNDPVELEAVISCTSDGLVVCLRRARPMIPHPTQRPSRPLYENGLFAAPWAQEPILPPLEARAGAGWGHAFAPSLGPHGGARPNASPVRANGPETHDFMAAIRDQAVFAWALTGINGTIERMAHGKPLGESLPAGGLPIWASDPRASESEADSGRSSSSGNGWGYERPGADFFGDPGLSRGGRSSGMQAGGPTNGATNGYAGDEL